MLGCHSGFQTLVKQLALTSQGVHCMLHRQALASKTLPDSIQTVLEQMIQIVNFIKAGALNSRAFKKQCSDMDADHLVLLYHTQTRWLSKGNVTRRFFELKEEVKALCELKISRSFVPGWMIKNGCSFWLTYVTFLNNLTNSIFRCKARIPTSLNLSMH